MDQTGSGANCNGCSTEYEFNSNGQLDLRLKQAKQRQLTFELGTHLPKPDFDFVPLEINKSPQVDFTQAIKACHLSKKIRISKRKSLISHFPKAKEPNSLMLDLGCGDTVFRDLCEHAGFEYVGLDYDAPKAPILGDAHALPFKDNSFEFVLSLAVLEHLRYPFVMMQEVHRVLKSEGKFMGTVSYLEPFHGDSFYHHTHLGVFNSLHYGGFTVERVAPNLQWSSLTAQASMGLFPNMPRNLCKVLVLPLSVLSLLWWGARGLLDRNVNKQDRPLQTVAAYTFIGSKDATKQ
jgi:SAM-dependent methyltransferase